MKRIRTGIWPLLILLSCLPSGAAAPAQWRVRSVEFTGNASYNDKALRNLMELKPKWPRYNTRYTDFMMRSDLEAMRAFYMSNGYEYAVVRTESVVRDSASGHVRIRIEINEGPRVHIKEVNIAADRFEMKEADMKKLSSKNGQPLIYSNVRQDSRLIKEALGNYGFVEAVVEPLVFIDSIDNSADIVFRVKEGPKAKIGNIILDGNRKVRGSVLRRELAFRVGDTLNLKTVQVSERRLYATGLFNYVQVKTDFDSGAVAVEQPDSTYDVRVRVTPGDFFRLQSGIGYGSDEGARVSLLTSYKNVFYYGHTITLDGKISQVSQRAEAVYFVPWAFYVPLYLETKIYYSRYDNPELYQGEFDGIRVSVGRQTEYGSLYEMWSQWERVQWVKAPAEGGAPAEIPDYPTQSIGVDVNLDTRNDLFNPTSGSYNHAGVEIAGIFGGNSNQFVRMVFDSRWYFNYKLRYFWSTALRTGWAMTYGKSDQVPVQRKFFGGGSSTVRGFDVNKLAVQQNGDPLKGNFYIFANIVDVRFPLYWWFNGAVFLDAGSVWPDFWDIMSAKQLAQDLRFSAGPGLRVDTPIRLVARLDLGFKLDRRPGESLMVWHFDLGQPF
jgi:outer membrane protein assembly complex protein YaeT